MKRISNHKKNGRMVEKRLAVVVLLLALWFMAFTILPGSLRSYAGSFSAYAETLEGGGESSSGESSSGESGSGESGSGESGSGESGSGETGSGENQNAGDNQNDGEGGEAGTLVQGTVNTRGIGDNNENNN